MRPVCALVKLLQVVKKVKEKKLLGGLIVDEDLTMMVDV